MESAVPAPPTGGGDEVPSAPSSDAQAQPPSVPQLLPPVGHVSPEVAAAVTAFESAIDFVAPCPFRAGLQTTVLRLGTLVLPPELARQYEKKEHPEKVEEDGGGEEADAGLGDEAEVARQRLRAARFSTSRYLYPIGYLIRRDGIPSAVTRGERCETRERTCPRACCVCRSFVCESCAFT